jgi:hypothetical protein
MRLYHTDILIVKEFPNAQLTLYIACDILIVKEFPKL